MLHGEEDEEEEMEMFQEDEEVNGFFEDESMEMIGNGEQIEMQVFETNEGGDVEVDSDGEVEYMPPRAIRQFRFTRMAGLNLILNIDRCDSPA